MKQLSSTGGRKGRLKSVSQTHLLVEYSTKCGYVTVRMSIHVSAGWAESHVHDIVCVYGYMGIHLRCVLYVVLVR